MWYRKAADQGFLASQMNLIGMYHEGLGIPKDNLMAFEWFKDLAVKGHVIAQYRLAEMYYQGENTDKDYIEAYAWSGIVAAHGFKPAEEIRDKTEAQLNKVKLQEARTLEREYWLNFGKKIDVAQ